MVESRSVPRCIFVADQESLYMCMCVCVLSLSCEGESNVHVDPSLVLMISFLFNICTTDISNKLELTEDMCVSL